jgi:hypothetical protein
MGIKLLQNFHSAMVTVFAIQKLIRNSKRANQFHGRHFTEFPDFCNKK